MKIVSIDRSELSHAVAALQAELEAERAARANAERQLAEQAKRLEGSVKQLKRSNEELEQFAYVASHDLQEPLRTISGYCQLLQRRYQSQLDGQADEFLSFIVDGAQRMKSLISDLLSYSRLGSRESSFTEADCEDLLQRSLAYLGVVIADCGATVTHDPLPRIHCDSTQMIQVFQNLIGNAIKFRRAEAPVVHVAVGDEQSHWRVSVIDNGIGIEQQHTERVFQIFQRLHTRDEFPGTGIGLSLCKKVIERHGGRIWIEQRVGPGAIVHFTLPKAAAS